MAESRNTQASRHHHPGRSSESLLDQNVLLKALNLRPGQTILDAGCGNGYMAKAFAQRVTDTGKVYALDPDEPSIEVLKSETEGSIIEPFVGDITQMTKLPDSSIDLIYLSTVIHGFSDRQLQGLSQEVKRLLKPEGVLAIVEIKKEDTPFGPPQEIRFSPEELRRKLRFAPQTLIDVGPYFYMQIFANAAAGIC